VEESERRRAKASGFLEGERIILRSLEWDDLVYIQKWSNDSELRGLIGEIAPMTMDEAREFYERVRKDEQRAWFVIVLKEDGRVIGEAGLLRIFPAWRTTDLSIILGERDSWGRGYGTEAIHLLLDYAFGCLKLHRVAIGVVDFNEVALRFYEKVGFKREGVQRDGYYFEHEYRDFVMMSILENEYRASLKEL
jgi:diamine N-acetyltransferase